MDPATVLIYLAAMFGVSIVGFGAVVGSGVRATKRSKALDEARRVAIANARWEARTIPLYDEWMRVLVVRVAQLGDDRWVVERRDNYVDVPVEDTTALINAQVEAQEAARAANLECP
jgi:hypothetical protein